MFLFTLNSNSTQYIHISNEIILKSFSGRKSLKKIIVELRELCNEKIKIENERISKWLKFLSNNLIQAIDTTAKEQNQQLENYDSELYDCEDMNKLYYTAEIFHLLGFTASLERLTKDDKFSISINRIIIYKNYKEEI